MLGRSFSALRSSRGSSWKPMESLCGQRDVPDASGSERRSTGTCLRRRRAGPIIGPVMIQSVKHLLAALLAIFAVAAMSVSAVQAGVMSIEMMTSDDGMASSSGDCLMPCPGEQDYADAMGWPPVCVAPVVAVLPEIPALKIITASHPYVFTQSPRLGRESLPDPYPPRIRVSV